MKELGGYENEMYISNQSQIWMRDPEVYKNVYCNKLVNKDYDCQYCIIGLDSLFKNIDLIHKLYENKRNDFFLLENKSSVHYLWFKLDDFGFDRMKCYALSDYTNEQLLQYFNLILKSVENTKIIDVTCGMKFNF
jgi:hypothetical protein